MSFYRITGIFSFIFYLTHCKTRALIRLVFAKLTLNEGKLSWEYSKAFKILSEAVEATNCPKVDKIDDFENGKFELTKKPDSSTQKDALLPQCPIWLPLKDLFINQELEFGISLSDLKIAFENLGLSQPKPAFATL